MSSPFIIGTTECSSFEQISHVVSSMFGKNIFILFSGDIDSVTKTCWCPDCNNCYPVIQEAVKTLKDDQHLIVCYVGDKPTWKSPENDFRKESPFKISCIPTLLNLKTGDKLEEEKLTVLDDVNKFFSS